MRAEKLNDTLWTQHDGRVRWRPRGPCGAWVHDPHMACPSPLPSPQVSALPTLLLVLQWRLASRTDTDKVDQAASHPPPWLTTPGSLRSWGKTEDFGYLVARLPVFAGSFPSGEYTPSRNVLDLEKQSGIFLIWDLRVDWIFKHTNNQGTKKKSTQQTECRVCDRQWHQDCTLVGNGKRCYLRIFSLPQGESTALKKVLHCPLETNFFTTSPSLRQLKATVYYCVLFNSINLHTQVYLALHLVQPSVLHVAAFPSDLQWPCHGPLPLPGQWASYSPEHHPHTRGLGHHLFFQRSSLSPGGATAVLRVPALLEQKQASGSLQAHVAVHSASLWGHDFQNTFLGGTTCTGRTCSAETHMSRNTASSTTGCPYLWAWLLRSGQLCPRLSHS